MLGLNIFCLYTTSYEENEDRIIARTTGEVALNDERRLVGMGWVKVNGSEYYLEKEREPEGSLEETDLYIEDVDYSS
uniref:Uncharacterized protein n=1 Tax=viral metagenome TaxID=1070528 RepID=A0A6M3LH77_9ZZZZ